MIGEKEQLGIILGLTMMSLLLAWFTTREEKEEPPIPIPPDPTPPEELDVNITGISWDVADYDYTNVWGDKLTAKLYKASLSLESNKEFNAIATISCPSIISQVKLLTEDYYNQVLSDIDELIATTTGYTQQLWIARKELALQFPSVDGFRIDYRWYSDWGWDDQFRNWISSVIEPQIWYPISVKTDNNTINLAFFKIPMVGVVSPSVVSIYVRTVEDGIIKDILLDTIQSDLPSAEEAPSDLSVTISTASPGGTFHYSVDIKVPEVIENQQMTTLVLSFNGLMPYYDSVREWEHVKMVHFMSPILANKLNNILGYRYAVPLDATDDRYSEVVEAIARVMVRIVGNVFMNYDVPQGLYPVYARMETWRIDVTDTGGINYYEYYPYARYDFGQVGVLEVI